jgi:hypothetical protein
VSERNKWHEYSGVIQRDWMLSVQDEFLGKGIGRRVFSLEKLHPGQPDLVIKVEDGNRKFQNVVEYDTWLHVETTRWARWFAPVYWISQNGTVLIMRRTQRPGPKQFPQKMPRFLTDFKRANYGILDGRIVCHDYGTNLAVTHGLSDQLRKVEWWD